MLHLAQHPQSICSPKTTGPLFPPLHCVRLNWNQMKRFKTLLHFSEKKRLLPLVLLTTASKKSTCLLRESFQEFPYSQRLLFPIKDTCHFTSYCRYCFLHSGVMWDERCCANFILPEKKKKTVLSNHRLNPIFFYPPVDATFSVNLLPPKKKKNAARALLLNSTAASSRSAHSGADPVPHTNYFSASLLQRYSGVSLSRSFSFFEAVLLGLTGAGARAAQWLCCVPPWAGLGTSRSAIALRPRLRGCVSRARAAEVVGTSSGRKKNKRVGSAASAPHTFYTDKSGPCERIVVACI